MRTILAQVSGTTDLNTSKKTGDQTECAIAKNPTNPLQLFVLCNNDGPGLFAARSTDGGATWIYPDPTDKTIADGNTGQGTKGWCDPNLAWDSFGNLFITYIDYNGTNIVTIMSTDGGATFSDLASFGPANVDQPSVVAANTTDPSAPVALWIVWNQSGSMVARGAAVTGLGTVGPFNALQTIPGTSGCSFGDIAIAPDGTVVQVCQDHLGGEGPSTIYVNTDADGLGAGNFGAAVAATTTNVGGFDYIPAQPNRSVDAEAGLAFDRNPTSSHFGRLYLVYTDETVNENNDMDIMLRFSDDNGTTWSAPLRVNDDPASPIRSQFLPKIATNPLSGNIAISWYDCRNSATNTAAQIYATMATPTGPSPAFMTNAMISDGASTTNGSSMDFGDYTGLAYFQGIAHPVWGDVSNSTGDNPNNTSNYDAYSDRVSGGAAASEGEPHITTPDGVHYDFQSAGEFVALRGDGLEIQTRQTAIATNYIPNANLYTGLATCLSMNTAVAARVGTHRITYQPNLTGIADPAGLQLRIDGVLTTVDATGRDLGSGGRIMMSSAGGGIEVDFPNGTTMFATPTWWGYLSIWYLNVDVYHTTATEGIMGVIAHGSWLPALPDGASLGPMPSALHDRYVALNEKFANAWRVTDATSLFDYAPGTSTVTFTVAGWPYENQPCVLPQGKPAHPIAMEDAQRLCRAIVDSNRKANAIFDVMVTGEPAFAKTYLLTQQLEKYATVTSLTTDNDHSRYKQPITFNAAVMHKALRGKGAPAGTVQFTVDGKKVGKPIPIGRNGRATWKTAGLSAGKHQVAARYIPKTQSAFLTSNSADLIHVVLE